MRGRKGVSAGYGPVYRLIVYSLLFSLFILTFTIRGMAATQPINTVSIKIRSKIGAGRKLPSDILIEKSSVLPKPRATCKKLALQVQTIISININHLNGIVTKLVKII